MSYGPTAAYFAASNSQDAAKKRFERGSFLGDTKQEKAASAARFENANSASLMDDTTRKVKAFLESAAKAGSMVDAKAAVGGIKNIKNATADDAWDASGLETDLNEAIRVTKANGFDTERAAPPPRKPATAGRRPKSRGRGRKSRRRQTRRKTSRRKQ
jgi:hypothetical protein